MGIIRTREPNGKKIYLSLYLENKETLLYKFNDVFMYNKSFDNGQKVEISVLTRIVFYCFTFSSKKKKYPEVVTVLLHFYIHRP